MAKYTVWTNVSPKRTVQAKSPLDAVSLYHNEVGELSDQWDGVLNVKDEHGEDYTFRRKKAA